MMGPPFFLLLWLLSLAMTVLVGIGLVTYIRRNWRGSRLDPAEERAAQILDGIDRIELRLTAMSERIERLEGRVGEGEGEGGSPRELSGGDQKYD
jgi:hypothetical protein